MPTPKLRQRVRNDATLAQGMIVLSSFIGVSLLRRFWQAKAPATIRRLPRLHHPFSAIAPSPDAEVKEVKPKFRDPVFRETWSGRGARPPLWVKRVMAERGWSLDDFKKSGEYDV